MVVVGLGNKVFQKLETYPMYHYPYFLSMWITFVYIPLSFAYIIPMILWGSMISKEQRQIPLYKFAIMGTLDCLASMLQSFAVNYIPSGALIILLSQSAIPISMIISKFMLKIKYELQHFIGAGIVFAGIAVVLVPQFLEPESNDDTNTQSKGTVIFWCFMMILSCVPMTLSSVYKEKALGEQDIDVVYLNGWVAVFQFMVAVLLFWPSAIASQLSLSELPNNLLDGWKCYTGHSSLPDDTCGDAPIYVNIYLAFNVAYNILIIMILKYGSSNILWLAMTLMVPLGFIAFSLPFMPFPVPIQVWSIVGLVVILTGLIVYRFVGPIKDLIKKLTKKNQGYQKV